MSLPTDQDYIDEAYAEIETLRQQLAEKDAEIERLKGMVDEIQAARHVQREHNRLLTNLASSQLREQQLREALEAVHAVSLQSHGIDGWHLNGEIATWDELLPEVAEALNIPTDDTALRGMIAKAGEVMRGRCAVASKPAHPDGHYTHVNAVARNICTIPGVTLEDLK